MSVPPFFLAFFGHPSRAIPKRFAEAFSVLTWPGGHQKGRYPIRGARSEGTAQHAQHHPNGSYSGKEIHGQGRLINSPFPGCWSS